MLKRLLCLYAQAQLLISDPHPIIEIIFLRSVQFTFAKALRVAAGSGF